MLNFSMLNFRNAQIVKMALAPLVVAGFALTIPAYAGQEIENNLSRCGASSRGVLVHIEGVKSSSGKIRVQIYKATKADWMAKGRWLKRMEVPASAGAMKLCLPMEAAGTYGIAVRHDVNSNGKTDLGKDGGGMSNNPSINIFNLGKPSHSKVAFALGSGLKSITIKMKYM